MRIISARGATACVRVVLQLLTVAATSACGAPGSEVGGDASVETDAAPAPTDDLLDPKRFRDAAKCPECEVLHSARLHLPETAVVAASAKLRTPDNRFPEITVNESGEVAEEKTLLANERAAARAKYGKLRPGLHSWVASAAESDRAWVWIWADVPRDDVRREDLLKDEAAAKAHTAKQQKALDAALEPIRVWLAKNAPDAELGDAGGPMLRAKLTAAQVRGLESLPQVSALGTDSYPGKALSSPWSSTSQWAPTIRLGEAHTIATGGSQNICIKEETRPDSTTKLVIAATANPSGPPSTHTRGMAGIIRNTDVSTAPWRSVAPSANIYIANWSGYSGTGGVNQWCRDIGAHVLNYSYTVAPDPSAGYAPIANDFAHDWLAKNGPFILVVASAGTIGSYDYVHNRGYNGLVVGSVLDQNTADRSDDLADVNAAWRNPVTAHNDHELPHVVAPGNGAAVTGIEVSGSSAATAMVSGTAALLSSGSLNGWPEAKRAVILATATGRADQGLITTLPGAGDRRIGVGEIDAFQAGDLGQAAYAASPSAVAAKGHTAMTADFASSFGGDGYLTTKWKAHADFSGRMRVAIAWDATAVCPSGTSGACTSETIDADFDLHLYKKTDGTWTTTGDMPCASSSWDSAYELCDIPVTAGEDYLIAIRKYSTTGTSTYLGVAWYLYKQPSGSPCTSGTECSSGTCTSGKCTCTSDASCPDRYCDGSSQCANRLANGTACTRAAQCSSGNCVDGVCCDTVCDGWCRACTTALKGGGANGVCGFVADGLDTDGNCDDLSPQSCGGGTVTRAQVCNGAGACRSDGSYSCGGFQCLDAYICRTTCTADGDCLSTYYCSGASCVAKKANGVACTAANQCVSGNCVDGVCCDTTCGGTCQACTLARKGSGADGTCGNIADGTNPDSECTPQSCSTGIVTNAQVCNGSGACRANGTTSCSGYGCYGSICATDCTSIACVSTHYCSSSFTCEPKKTNGAACGASAECTSGFCVDGVCCNSACGASCQACNVAGSVGTCTATDETGCAPICGNGWRNEAEECDDGLGTSTSVRRSCSSTCQVQDLLAVPHVAPTPPTRDTTPERYLGTGRHPIGVTSTGYALAYVEDAGSIGKVGLATFDAKGVALDPSKLVAASAPFDANPVVAGLPDGNYAVAHTDFGGDGDALGIALRKFNPSTGAAGTVTYANGTTNFSQYDADMIWTGTELVVAWVDTSNGSTGPDLRFRRFTSSLTPIAAEETLANTAASESDVALTTFGTGWAAAWRSAFAGMETVYVRAAGKTWTAATILPGPTQAKPALVELDATHILLVYVEHGWDSTAGTLTPSQLRGAIVDTTTTGGALTSAPIDSSTTSMTTPTLARVPHTMGTRFYLGWRNDAVSGSSAGDELWLKEILWSSTTPDFTATEITLPRWSAHVVGDQRAPSFAAGAVTSGPALIAAWEDYGTSLGPPRTAVVSQLAPTPILRMP